MDILTMFYLMFISTDIELRDEPESNDDWYEVAKKLREDR